MSGIGRPPRTGSHSLRSRMYLLVATTAILVAALLWTALAGGTQPYQLYEETVAADGPVAQYRFDDSSGSSSVNDSAGSDSASNSGITLGEEGPFAGSHAGVFNGEAFASLPVNPLAEAKAFTFEAWVYWNGGTSYNQPIFSLGSSSSNFMLLTPAASSSGHKLLFEIHTSSLSVQLTATKLGAKEWAHVAVTETSGGSLVLYTNGEQVAQTTTSLSPASLGNVSLNHLGKTVASEQKFLGKISNVAFYTTALTSTRVLTHYKAGERPGNTVLPSISGTAKDGKVLTAKAGTWTGLSPITFAFQWERCSPSGSECLPIGSPRAETKYTIQHEDVGKALRVAVTATNTQGEESAVSAQTAAVEALKPVNTGLPVISGQMRVGQLVSTSSGSWEGGSPPTEYEYQWEVCNNLGEKCKAIAGATSSTFRITSAQLADTLRVAVTAVNSGGHTNATSETSGVISYGEPVSVSTPTISGEARVGQTLTASTGSWAGSPSISYSYQWQRCNASSEAEPCTDISGATGSTYKPTSSDIGYTLDVVVTATNAWGSNHAASSHTGAVPTEAPLNTSPPAIGGSAREGSTLTASHGTWTGTEPITYAYQWERCDESGAGCEDISGATATTLALTHEYVGARMRVRVTATNGAGSESSTSAPSTAIEESSPTSSTPPTITGTPAVGETLTASTGSWSGGPPTSYAYQWQVCSGTSCAPVVGATASTYTPTTSDLGERLRVSVIAHNGAGSGEALSATTAKVEGSAGGSACDETWTGAAGDGSWENGNNWVAQRAPGPEDHVCIPAAAVVTVSAGGNHAGWISDNGTLQVISGSISIEGPHASSLVTLSILGGTLTGAGEVDVTGSFTGGGYGTMAGSGSTVIESGASGALAANTRFTLSERTLSNAGMLTVPTQAGLETNAHAQIVNSGQLVMNGEPSGNNYGLMGGEATLQNTGTIEKTEGAGTTPIQPAIDNKGTVSASAGTIELTGGGSWSGGSDGTWSTSGAAGIVFSATWNEWNLGPTLHASGNITFAEGKVTTGRIDGSEATLTVSGNGGRFSATLAITGSEASEVRSLTVERGTLVQTGEVTVSTAFTGGGYGIIEGTGTVRLEPGLTGTIPSDGTWLNLSHGDFVNEGSLAIETGAGIMANSGVQLENSGTLVVNGESAGANHGLLGGSASLKNTGTIEKTEGSGVTTVGVQIDNEGSVVAHSGTLEMSGGGTWGGTTPGSWGSSGAGSGLVFRNGDFALGASATMYGSITIGNGATSESGVHVGHIEGPEASVTVTGEGGRQGGDLDLAGPGISTVRDLAVSGTSGFFANGGTLTGPGEIDVARSFVGGPLGLLTGGATVALGSGSTGTIQSGWLTMDDATLVNDGMLTIPTATGLVASSGGAHIQNHGVLVVNGENTGSNEGLIATPGTATLLNTGTLRKTEGSGTTTIEFAIDNESHVEAETGKLQFLDGGNSGQLSTDSWASAPGASIALNGFLTASYSLGSSATISGHMTLHASISAGVIDGAEASIVSELGNVALTGLEASSVNNLTLSPPEPNYRNEQNINITDELDVLNELTWSSDDASLQSGAIVSEPETTTTFNPTAWINIRGGEFVNWGEARWLSGGFNATGAPGIFFENLGTFAIEQDGSNPVVYGCEGEGESLECPALLNEGTVTATFPTAEGVSRKIEWRADITNYGTLAAPYWTEPRCEWEYSETPGPGAEACNREIDEYEGLLLEDGARVIEAEPCAAGEEESTCPEEEPEGEVLEFEEEEEEEEEEELPAARPLDLRASAVATGGAPKDAFRDTTTGNVRIPAFDTDGNPLPPYEVHIWAQISLNGRQARFTFRTSTTPAEVTYIGLKAYIRTSSKKTLKTELHEPLNAVKFNMYLPKSGFTEEEVRPEYIRPKAVSPGIAKVKFRDIGCALGHCEFIGFD